MLMNGASGIFKFKSQFLDATSRFTEIMHYALEKFNMKKITVHCNSRSDPDCFGTVEIYLPYVGSYAAEPHWDVDVNRREVVASVRITPNHSQREQWLADNREHLMYNQDDLIITQGYFDLDYEDIDDKEVCGACGTDQEHENDDDD